MKKYVVQFFQRGLAFGGFGPVIMAIVYLILSKTLDAFTLTGNEVFISAISTYLLAFVHAGASVFNQIEHWPVSKSLLCHMSVLYVSYLVCYLINAWLPFDLRIVLAFTAFFIITYLLIWAIVVIVLKSTSRKFNQKIDS